MKINAKNMFKKSLMALAVVALAMSLTFCKNKDNATPQPTPNPDPETPITPDPVNGKLPDVILPAELYDSVSNYLRIFEGDNPPTMNYQCVSKPHRLFYASSNFNPDTIQYYSDRYVAFIASGNRLDFYGKQFDIDHNEFENTAQRGIKIVGDTTSFTCYYLEEGHPNGLFAQQSTIFSGIVTDEGLKDFQVAVILLETSGNPNLQEKNSFRILGDEDHLAEDTAWFNKKYNNFDVTKISDEELFKMWKK